MNTAQMRLIDHYLGGAVCLLLAGFACLQRLLFRPRPPVAMRKILVTKYLGMGSILLATPTLRLLRQTYPDSQLTFLTFDSNANFAERLGVIDRVYRLRTGSLPAFVSDLFSVVRTLRREKFDLVLDLEFFSRFSTIVSYLSGAPMRVGYYLAMPWRSELLTHLVNYSPYRHITEVFASQLAPLGLEVRDFSLIPPQVPAAAAERVRTLLHKEGFTSGERLIVVNVNASELAIERRWPAENFIALLSVIAAMPGRRAVLTGAATEAEYVAALHARLPAEAQRSVVNLAGRLSIEEFIALLTGAALCITSDSGPLHIAAALGLPTVSFFGPETPTRYGPVGDNHLVFFTNLYCSPCLSVYNAKRAGCRGEIRCMQSIEAETVIERLLANNLL